MRTLALTPLSQLAGLAPLAVRVILGIIMIAHGAQKLEMGPANFGQKLAGIGVPFPVLTGYMVTFAELIGGILLVVGLLSRLAALLLTVNLTVAILLVNVGIGFLTPPGAVSSGVELPLALIAGFLAILLAGPGKLSLDHALGIERHAEGSPARRWKHGHCVGSPPRKPE
jgi:putative oxidoreductase